MIASGSEQSPKASSPPSEIIETRRAWRSAGSANELNCSTAWPEDQRPLPRPGDVRDREREFARARGQPGHAAIQRAEAAYGVEKGVERVGVVVELPLPRLRVDQPQAGGRVGLGDRQVDVHEGVAVAELPRVLLAGVQADGALDPEVVGDPPDLGEPAAKASGDHGEYDVVDGGALGCAMLDPLQPLEGKAGPGDLAGRADVLVELGVPPGAELPPQGGGQGPPGCVPRRPGRLHGSGRGRVHRRMWRRAGCPRPRAGRRSGGSRSPRRPSRGGCARSARPGRRSAVGRRDARAGGCDRGARRAAHRRPGGAPRRRADPRDRGGRPRASRGRRPGTSTQAGRPSPSRGSATRWLRREGAHPLADPIAEAVDRGAPVESGREDQDLSRVPLDGG